MKSIDVLIELQSLRLILTKLRVTLTKLIRNLFKYLIIINISTKTTIHFEL